MQDDYLPHNRVFADRSGSDGTRVLRCPANRVRGRCVTGIRYAASAAGRRAVQVNDEFEGSRGRRPKGKVEGTLVSVLPRLTDVPRQGSLLENKMAPTALR